MKKTIRDYELEGKKVIIRCDFNVPMKDGEITDDNRIKESILTIQYAMKHGAKVILMSHLGRVKEESDKDKNSLKPVAERLSTYLNQEVLFVPVTRGETLENAISNLADGEVLLMENTRFEDIDGKKESGNEEALGSYWASLGDLFINDAFGTAHRAHASNDGIASHLPSGVGFLMEKELTVLGGAIQNPKHPFAVILGGSKVSDKINVIENLVHKADYILVGGGMSFTFLKALGYSIGSSLLDEENIEFCKRIINDNKEKIILPVDALCAHEMSDQEKPRVARIDDIHEDESGYDIGPETVALFASYLKKSETIVWNGPVGVVEIESFTQGTKALCDILGNSDAVTILGGGDTAGAAIHFGYKDAFTHISTGGGASLELLEGKSLRGIEKINEK